MYRTFCSGIVTLVNEVINQRTQRIESALRGLESPTARERKESSAFLRQCARTTGMLCLVSSSGFAGSVAGVIASQPLPEVKPRKQQPAVATVNQYMAKVDSMFLALSGGGR